MKKIWQSLPKGLISTTDTIYQEPLTRCASQEIALPSSKLLRRYDKVYLKVSSLPQTPSTKSLDKVYKWIVDTSSKQIKMKMIWKNLLQGLIYTTDITGHFKLYILDKCKIKNSDSEWWKLNFVKHYYSYELFLFRNTVYAIIMLGKINYLKMNYCHAKTLNAIYVKFECNSKHHLIALSIKAEVIWPNKESVPESEVPLSLNWQCY